MGSGLSDLKFEKSLTKGCLLKMKFSIQVHFSIIIRPKIRPLKTSKTARAGFGVFLRTLRRPRSGRSDFFEIVQIWPILACFGRVSCCCGGSMSGNLIRGV